MGAGAVECYLVGELGRRPYPGFMTKNATRDRDFRFVTHDGLEGTLEVVGNRVVLSNPELGARRVFYKRARAKRAFADLSRELVRRGKAIETPAGTSVKA